MRILALTRYASPGSSSRVRFYQYIPTLKSCGVEIQVAALLDAEYIRRLYAEMRPSIPSVIEAYLKRISWLTRSRSYDLLWIEKELFPWFPAWAETSIKRTGIPYVADYDDAVFHRYDQNSNPLIRSLLGGKIDTVMRNANTVVVGNDYLAERARQAGARQVEVLPSVVDLDRYSVCEKDDINFRIGWIGSPITAPYLGLILDALKEVLKKYAARLVLVGSGIKDPLPGIDKEIQPWNEAGEVRQIQSFDVGIMPVPDQPFERGKCGYKLIQYMACGLPVIASPVGVNANIVEPGKTGFLASSNADWVQALVRFFEDPGMRADFGRAGRKKVEREYSLQITAPRLLEILGRASRG